MEFLGLTLEQLLSLVVLPEKDAGILVRVLSERLGLGSVSDRVADFL